MTQPKSFLAAPPAASAVSNSGGSKQPSSRQPLALLYRDVCGDVDGVRREFIFQGDKQTADEAREASDGLEHGFMELGDVYDRARRTAEVVFGYVRNAILKLAEVQGTEAETLQKEAPLDVQSLRQVVRGHFIGEPGASFAAQGQEYPLLRWERGIKRCWMENDKMQIMPNDTIQVTCAEGVQFRAKSYAVYGRKIVSGETEIRNFREGPSTPTKTEAGQGREAETDQKPGGPG